MRPITEVKELRQIQIAILDQVVAFCDENGINYSLAGGTLIGALRHKGYIPWDDDIDLYLPREDYDRFVEKWKDTSHLVMLNPNRTKRYLYTFTKIVDSRTILEENEVPGYQIGVYVDVFPIDFVPDDERKRHRQFKFMKLAYKMRRCKMQSNYLDNLFHYLCYRYFPLPLGFINSMIEHILWRKPKSSLVCNVTDANFGEKGIFPARCYEGEYAYVTFEGKKYKAMPGYEEYLRTIYGDYMQLPPVEQREHHWFKAYWKD